MNTEALSRPDGVEVKLSIRSVNLIAIFCFFTLLIGGTCVFVYIWDEFTSYGIGYYLGSSFKKLGLFNYSCFIILYYVLYTFLQGGLLYWFSGKKRKNLRWHGDWGGFGFHPICPIALKYYRICLLLPGILLGLLPAIHGFCTGSGGFFYAGLYGIILASADVTLFCKLHVFDDEDLLVAGKKTFEATIIKRNYGKESPNI